MKYYALETSRYVKLVIRGTPRICIQAAIEHEPYIQVRYVCTDGIIIDIPKTAFCEEICKSLLKRIQHLLRVKSTPEIWKEQHWIAHGLTLKKYPPYQGTIPLTYGIGL